MTTPIEPGQRFGWLTVVRRTNAPAAGYSIKWLCRCACGRESEVKASALRSGHTTSCGCKRAGALVDGRLRSGRISHMRKSTSLILDTDFDE